MARHIQHTTLNAAHVLTLTCNRNILYLCRCHNTFINRFKLHNKRCHHIIKTAALCLLFKCIQTFQECRKLLLNFL